MNDSCYSFESFFFLTRLIAVTHCLSFQNSLLLFNWCSHFFDERDMRISICSLLIFFSQIGWNFYIFTFFSSF